MHHATKNPHKNNKNFGYYPKVSKKVQIPIKFSLYSFL
jgi:hypothetical protein